MFSRAAAYSQRQQSTQRSIRHAILQTSRGCTQVGTPPLYTQVDPPPLHMSGPPYTQVDPPYIQVDTPLHTSGHPLHASGHPLTRKWTRGEPTLEVPLGTASAAGLRKATEGQVRSVFCPAATGEQNCKTSGRQPVVLSTPSLDEGPAFTTCRNIFLNVFSLFFQGTFCLSGAAEKKYLSVCDNKAVSRGAACGAGFMQGH